MSDIDIHLLGRVRLPLGIVGEWTCVLHPAKTSHGSAKPLRGCVHHVWPRGAGGPDIAANRITICETGHSNLHTIMWAMVNDRPVPECTRLELHYATLGVQQWIDAGKPGSISAFMA